MFSRLFSRKSTDFVVVCGVDVWGRGMAAGGAERVCVRYMGVCL